MNTILESDLKEFFELNNIISINHEADFKNLLNSKSTKYTIPIIDYVLATMIKVPKSYKLSEILLVPDLELKSLAAQLELPNVDKDRIIRILKYANKLESDLDIFNVLPDESLLEIVRYLSCDDLLRLCKITNRASLLCNEQILRSKLNVNYNIEDFDKHELINTCLIQKQINNIAVGDNHVLILRPDGKVYGYGANEFGQLNSSRKSLTKAEYLGIDGIQVACGANHSLVLTKNFEVIGFGLNRYNQLGNIAMRITTGKKEQIIEKVKIDKLPKIIQIAAGNIFSLLLAKDGTVYKLGSLFGNIDKFENLNIVEISAHSTHALMLSNKGEVYSIGYDNFGQLGTGNTDDYEIPQLIMTNANYISTGEKTSVVIDNEGTKVFGVMFDDYYETPKLVNIKGNRIIAGVESVYTIDYNGKVEKYIDETHSIKIDDKGVTDLVVGPDNVVFLFRNSLVADANGVEFEF